MVIDYSLPRRSPTILQQLRSDLDDKETNVEVICKEFLRYATKDEYAIFESRLLDGSVRRVASLVSKRGNVKYVSGVKKRFDELIVPFELMPNNDVLLVNGKTSVLYQTLTYDAKLCDFKTCIRRIGVEVNRYLSNLKKRFHSRVLIVARCFEAFKSGYFHVHLVLYFQDYSFHTFKRHSKKQKRDVWRIDTWERDKFRRYWHSNIDVQGMVNLHESLRYIEKYIAKASNLALNDGDNKGLKTLALSWAFGKRSFSVSKKFKQIVFEKYLSLPSSDLNSLSVIQTVSEQMTLGKIGETDFGAFGGEPVVYDKGIVKWVRRRQTVSKELMRAWGGIPKDDLGFGSRFSFGLCDSQKVAISEYFGEVGLSGSGMSLADRSALFFGGCVDFGDSRLVKDLREKLFRQKPVCKPLTEENCRELRVLPYKKPMPAPVEVRPVKVERLEGLSDLALYARKLRLAVDASPSEKGRVNPSLREDGSVRYYE